MISKDFIKFIVILYVANSNIFFFLSYFHINQKNSALLFQSYFKSNYSVVFFKIPQNSLQTFTNFLVYKTVQTKLSVSNSNYPGTKLIIT